VSDWNASHPQDLCQYEISFINASTEIQEGSHAVPKWVESGITCVVGRTDLCAIGAVSAAMRLGLSVPRDFSVVGCNNDSLGEFLFPSITTFGLDKKQLVDRAVKILFSQFGETQSATSHVIVPVELIVRQSSAQVRSTERSSIEPKQIGPS
jgi:LacI family transcriptional regulator